MYLDTYDSGNDDEDENDQNPHLEDSETDYVDHQLVVSGASYNEEDDDA